ncbi:DUF1835 domain-containing protein [Bacillus sp. APMAM]|nr:DUF1835 domain-containing protein [Bacillus sp. APMAM]RTZ55808.1 DUF1835 domain-containing protein [Bacillus sp. SAJ1]
MKTRVNELFVYFFEEPNVVFVYRIRSPRYVTASNLLHKWGWETFELADEEAFETFHHEERKPLEGRGYFINQEGIQMMVEKINEQIHILRSKTLNGNTGAYHLISSESAAGSLRVGLERPKTVIGFPGFANIGPILNLEGNTGRTNRYEWFLENINFPFEDAWYENHFSNTLYEIEDIPEHAPIHIWYANNAEEQTFLRFVLYLLKNKQNDVFLHNSFELYLAYKIPPENVEYYSIHSGGISPEHFKFIFQKEKTAAPLSLEEREKFHQEWEELSKTTGVLRVWIDEKVQTVPEDYFDTFILNSLKELHREKGEDEFIKTNRLIGYMLGELEEPIGDSFLEYRIRHLIYSGKFDLKGIPKSMHHYSVRLRK